MTEPDHLARAVVQRIAEQMERNTFSDLQVVVEGVTFECHRFLLSACSDFFRALLTSGMREDKQRQVEVHGMEHSTFRLVLDCVYKAKYILKSSNAFDVWHAANQLQIGFLLDHCEMFLAKELTKDNCVKIYIHSKLLDSQNLKNLSWELMHKEFDYIRKHDDILHLEVCDIKTLIEDNDLDIPNEDVVIDLILRWVAFNPEENSTEESTEDNENITADQNSPADQNKKALKSSRSKQKQEAKNSKLESEEETPESFPELSSFKSKQKEEAKNPSKLESEGETPESFPELSSFKSRRHHLETKVLGKPTKKDESDRKLFLPDLLTAARICLISGSCLQALTQNRTVIESPKAFAIVQEVLRYQLQPGNNDYPPYAMHRNKSDLDNVLMAITPGPKMSARTRDGSWFQLNPPPYHFTKCDVVAYENDLYGTGNPSPYSFPKCDVVAYENDLYVTGTDGTRVAAKYDTNTNTWRQIAALNSNKTNHALVCLNNFIYAVGGDNCTKIERFDAGCEQKNPGTSKWEVVGNLDQAVFHTTATVYGNHIVVLGCLADDDTVSTIQSFNVQSLNAFNYLDRMPGSAKNMIAISHSDSNYLLQESGSFWKLTDCHKTELSMEFLGMLWDFTTVKIYAATIQNQELFILGGNLDPQTPTEWMTTTQKSFKKIKIIQREANCFLGTIIKKTFLTTKEA